MSYRRRHRWFRRMALGLAFATAALTGNVSFAAAKPSESAGGSRYVTAGGWSGHVDMESGVPFSAGIPHGDEQYLGVQPVKAIHDRPVLSAGGVHGVDPYLTDVFVRPGEALGGPDGRSGADGSAVAGLSSEAIAGDAVTTGTAVATAGSRPDDRSDRFTHSDVVPQLVLASSGSTFEWNDALTLGIGALVLALGLGLALGYLRRPRIAGL